MKWDNDALRYEKYILFDGIIAFYKKMRDRETEDVSLKDLSHFVDEFFLNNSDTQIDSRKNAD